MDLAGDQQAWPRHGGVLVVVPTYDEADNIAGIVGRIRRAVPAADVLVADDNSPDGTGRIAEELAAADGQVRVLHRPGKQGLGATYVAAFGWARAHGYDMVVQMDADGSHAPEDLWRLLVAARGADVVIGSRWVRGSRVVGCSWQRVLLSRAGNLYARMVLGVPVRDVTGGYRVYRVAAFDKLGVGAARSQGYSFQVELSRRACRAGLRIAEVPITFTDRRRGASKMSLAIVAEALWRVSVWGIRDRGPRAVRGQLGASRACHAG